MSIKYGVMPIQYDISSIKTIECYDLTGELLYSVNIQNEQSTEDISKVIDLISNKIEDLLEAEKNYPEDIDDLNDYLGLICSINKLIKLKAIMLANMMREKDIMSFVKKEKYLYPVIECYSDTGRDVTGKMIRYYIKYAKNKIEYIGYDNAMFDCC